MFNSGAKNETVASPMEEQLTDNEMQTGDIHTMPNEFLAMPAPAQKGKGKWIIIGVVIFLFLGAGIAGAFYFLKQQAPANVVEQPVQQNNPDVTATPEETPEQNNLATASLRDVARLTAMSEIRTALLLYFKTFQMFPTDLTSLKSNGSITEVPLNPQPGGMDYTYTTTSDKLNFSLLFSLEDSANWGTVILPAGEYRLTPEGIFPNTLPNTNTPATPQIPNNGTPTTTPATDNNFVPGNGLDTDGDGLTDIEENVYKTNSALADTDGDTYSDSAEILNFYDPTSKTGRLVASGLVKVYKNETNKFSLLYPASWPARALSDNEIIFTSNTGEFISITVQDNPLSKSAYNWYVEKVPNVNPSDLKNLTMDGLPAVQSADGLNTYLGVGSKIYIISYNIGAQQQANFKTTYTMFLKSFMFPDAK